MLLRKRNNYMYTYLIVDDEMIERKGIRMLLSWMNIRENILEASNGEEALEVFEKEKIDVLPVSYTHLDVYKRQPYSSMQKSMWRGFRSCCRNTETN